MKYMKISLIFIVASLMITSIAGVGAALSNDGGGKWQYYRELTITNSGSALTDYQVLVQLSGSSFPTTTSNGADIRFTDASGNELNYWIESWDYAGKSGSIWVKVPNLPSSGNTIIKMYYGNPSAASMSDGEGTFDFFDDFNTNSIGTKWQINTGYGALSDTSTADAYLDSPNSRAVVNSVTSQALVTKSFFKRPLVAEMKWTFNGPFMGEEYTAAIQYYDSHYSINSYNVFAKSNGSWIRYANTSLTDYSPSLSAPISTNTWYIQRLTLTTTTVRSSILSPSYSELSYNTLDNADWDNKKIGIDNFNDGRGGAMLYIDWIRVRKYAFIQPTIALGAEHSVTPPPITGNISVSSSPTGSEVFVDGASKGHAPVIVPNVSPGSHAVKCKLSGYTDYDTSATVTAGSTSSVMCSLTPIGELLVKLSSEPESIQPGQISTIKITVTKDGAPVSGANVMLSSTPSVKFIPLSGTTTINGEFISNFTASTEGDIKISALAKKEDINDGKGYIVVQVGKITPPPEKQATITGKVMDAGTDDPLQDVTITVDGKSAVTGSNGEYELLVDVGKHNLSASKSGYETMTRSIIVPEVGTIFDISLKTTSLDWSLIIIILILIVVASGIISIFYRKKKQKEKEQKEKREKEIKEREEKEKREKEERERKEKEEKERKSKEKKSLCMYCHAPFPTGSKFCNECGKKQEEKTRFCMNCGDKMPHAPDPCTKCGKLPLSHTDVKTCKNCGEVIPLPAKFCSACGAGQPE